MHVYLSGRQSAHLMSESKKGGLVFNVLQVARYLITVYKKH